MSARKIVVIGLDGATFDVMRPLIARGELPHLGAVHRDGAAGELLSTIPFVTPTAFASFMTGVDPGKHGIFDFTRDGHGTYDTGPVVDYTSIRTPTLWELLGRHGRRSILVTVPFTHPAPAFDGIAVSIGNMAEGPFSAQPPGLAEEILARIGGYDARYLRVVREPDGPPSEELLDYYIEQTRYQTEKVKQAALYLMRAYSWDVMMTVFVITDRFQHYFWRDMDSEHPAHEVQRRSKYGQVIPDAYRQVDAAVGEILAAAPRDADVIVMSDHGFGPLYHVFYTNRWLQEQGFLRLGRDVSAWELARRPLGEVLSRVGFRGLAPSLPPGLGRLRVVAPRRKASRRPIPGMVDWARTRAYATRWGININLAGREPSGIVQPGREYDVVADAIVAALRRVADPATSAPLFDTVARRETVYRGWYADEAHDIVVAADRRPTELHPYPLSRRALRPITARDVGNGHHRRPGVLMMSGPSIGGETEVHGARIEDLAPTILYLGGLPVPEYMDGRVLTTALRPDLLARAPISRVPTSARRDLVAADDGPPDAASDDRLREQLKALGYLT